MLNLHANTREDYGEHRRNSYLGMEILDYRDGVCVMVDMIVNLHANQDYHAGLRAKHGTKEGRKPHILPHMMPYLSYQLSCPIGDIDVIAKLDRFHAGRKCKRRKSLRLRTFGHGFLVWVHHMGWDCQRV